MIPRTISAVLLAVFMALAGGCSPYVGNYHYVPRPAMVAVPGTQPADPPNAVVLASVVGIRRGDAGKHIPEAVEIRVRVEANREPVVFDPTRLDLVTGSLTAFPPAVVTPASAVTIPANQQADFTAIFPLPAGTTHERIDLSSLRMRARLTVGDRPIETDVSFQRLIPVYVDPYYDPFYDPWYGYHGRFFFGAGYHRHWR